MDREEARQELSSFEKEIMLRKASGDRLCTMIYNFPQILAAYPDLKQETFNVWEKVAESKQNSRYSVEDTYSSLKNVILKDRNTEPQAFSVYTKTLTSHKNDYETLCLAQETLLVIAQFNPAFAGRAAEAFNKALDRYEESITPKTPLKKFFQQLHDVNGRIDFEKQNIQKMRDDTKRFLPKNSPIVASKSRGMLLL